MWGWDLLELLGCESGHWSLIRLDHQDWSGWPLFKRSDPESKNTAIL